MMAVRFVGTARSASCGRRVRVAGGARHDLAHQRGHEQRHSVRALVQRTDEGFVAGQRWQVLSDVFGDLGFGERIEHDFLAHSVQPQLMPHPVEWMIQRDDLSGTKACQPHEARAAAPTGDVVDELNGRTVAPMQVLGHQQQRPALGIAIEHLAHLAQHSIQAHSRKLASQRIALLGAAQPRQLQQPGRRHGTQQGRNATVEAA